MSAVPDVHALLHWANRSEVAREITRRGYRVSVETLNRWHRDRKELPAVVERIVFDLFGVDSTKSPPAWAEGLEQRLTETILANRETVIQALAEQAARYGVEQALGEQPPVEPAPETREAVPGPAGRR